MSKDKKKKDGLDDEMLELLQEEKKVKLKKRKMRADCKHIKKSGKTRLQATGKPHIYKCTRCGTEVDLTLYSQDESPEEGLEYLSEAIETVKNACEILKQRAGLDMDSKKSRAISDFAAQMCFQLPNIEEFMRAFRTHVDEKKNKEKARKKEIKIGLDSLAFNHHRRGGKKDKKW